MSCRNSVKKMKKLNSIEEVNCEGLETRELVVAVGGALKDG